MSLQSSSLSSNQVLVVDSPNLVSGALRLVNQPDNQISTTLNQTTGSLPVGAITGAGAVFVQNTNATPGAQLVRSALQMYGDTPNAFIGLSWRLVIQNSGAGTLTLTADAGATVTLSGTMTVSTNTWAEFLAVFTGTVAAPTATITRLRSGTFP